MLKKKPRRKKHAEEEAAIAARVHSALLAVLRPRGKAAKLGAITKAGGYIAVFAAPTPGTVTIAWYEVPKGAHVSSAKPVLVATTTAKVGAIANVKVHVRLTAKGRRLLRHARSQKLTARATFTPTGETRVHCHRHVHAATLVTAKRPSERWPSRYFCRQPHTGAGEPTVI